MPIDTAKVRFEYHTRHIGFHVRGMMAALNEVDVETERKLVELDLDIVEQGIAKVTIQWTPPRGRTPEDFFVNPNWDCPRCELRNSGHEKFCIQCEFDRDV